MLWVVEAKPSLKPASSGVVGRVEPANQELHFSTTKMFPIPASIDKKVTVPAYAAQHVIVIDSNEIAEPLTPDVKSSAVLRLEEESLHEQAQITALQEENEEYPPIPPNVLDLEKTASNTQSSLYKNPDRDDFSQSVEVGGSSRLICAFHFRGEDMSNI